MPGRHHSPREASQAPRDAAQPHTPPQGLNASPAPSPGRHAPSATTRHGGAPGGSVTPLTGNAGVSARDPATEALTGATGHAHEHPPQKFPKKFPASLSPPLTRKPDPRGGSAMPYNAPAPPTRPPT